MRDGGSAPSPTQKVLKARPGGPSPQGHTIRTPDPLPKPLMPRKLDLPDSHAAPDDGLPFAPSAARNAAPVGDVLARHLPARGSVLELASGTGQHAVAFAARFPGLTWQPSDLAGDNLATIRARAARAALPNLRAPLALDA